MGIKPRYGYVPLGNDGSLSTTVFWIIALLALFMGLGDKRRNRLLFTDDYHNADPKIFCILITAGATQNDRVPVQAKTWLQRCDGYQIYTDMPMEGGNYPYKVLNRLVQKNQTWHKFRDALTYAFTQRDKNYDFYIRSDDDSFVILENFKEFVSNKNPDNPYYIGFNLRSAHLGHGYVAGSSVVFSRKTVEVLVNKLFMDHKLCDIEDRLEDDLAIARCLATEDIYPYRFHDQVQPFQHFSPHLSYDSDHSMEYLYHSFFLRKRAIMFQGYDAYYAKQITFHHIFPQEIVLMEELLYKLKVANRTGPDRFEWPSE